MSLFESGYVCASRFAMLFTSVIAPCAVDAFGGAELVADVQACLRVDGQTCETLALIAEVPEVLVRHRQSLTAMCRIGGGDVDDLFRFIERQAFEQHGVCERKNRAV